ncbi:MAG: V-type ATP synthase subunit D [Promethearchaeota archaeon]
MTTASSFKKIIPTTSNYHKLKKQLAFTTRGQRLLELKRDQLLQLIRNLKRRFETARREMSESMAEAYRMLNVAYMEMGKENVVFFSEFLKEQPVVDVVVTFTSKLGIDLPSIKATWKPRERLPPYGFVDTSIFFDRAIIAFREALGKILVYAELENSLLSYLWEYNKMHRRIRALDEVIIPRIRENFTFIEQVLEEQEQEEFIRLKEIKKMLEKREAARLIPEKEE